MSHIKAAEDPSASGRYIITNRSPFDGRFITDVIKEHWPAAVGSLPDGEKEELKEVISNDKVRERMKVWGCCHGSGCTFVNPLITGREGVGGCNTLGFEF